MNSFNFCLMGMTELRYFVPLIAEANRRNIKSRVFFGRIHKYCCPHLFVDILQQVAMRYKFDLIDISKINDYPAPTFLIEGDGIDHIKYKNKKYSITYMTDFTHSYKNYINKVDHVIFPSKYFADHYELQNQKNLYLGSPKYSIKYKTNSEIMRKYGIVDNKKNALVVFPRARDINKVDLKKIYNDLKNLNYNIIVKSRGKDPIPEQFKGDYNFLDETWEPHPTLELLRISDVTINFSSTVIKECVMLNVPVINFHVKPFSKPLGFLYDFEYCKHLTPDYQNQELQGILSYFESNKARINEDFENCRKRYLFDSEKAAIRIIDYALKK